VSSTKSVRHSLTYNYDGTNAMSGRSNLKRGMMCLAAIALVAGLVAPVGVRACPFCAAPSMTLTEQLAKADAALLVELKSSREGTDSEPGKTTFKVVDVIRDSTSGFKKDGAVDIPRFRSGKSGDLALLMGTKIDTLEWSDPLPVTKEIYDYVAAAPSFDADPRDRLVYFLKFLEHADPTIANDAYAEFANAPYKDITRVVDKMPKEQIRGWVMNAETSPTRLGLYGLMLGLCGDEKDAQLMEQRVVNKGDDEFRLGIDGVMGGYLLLKGAAGLDVVDKAKFLDKKVPFSETYAALQALRFMWQYGEDRIPKERLRASMRLLLDRPELSDIVIADLARWKDWSVQERLRGMYGEKDYDVPSVKRAIVRYMFASTKDTGEKQVDEGKPIGEDRDAVAVPAKPEKSEPAEATDTAAPVEKGPVPPHVALGRKYIDELRERDPKLVKDVERFLY
jgi:hypothetical protein